MADPLTDIEDRKGQIDMGTMMYRIYLGARQDGASRLDALLTTAAVWVGISQYNKENEEGGE